MTLRTSKKLLSKMPKKTLGLFLAFLVACGGTSKETEKGTRETAADVRVSVEETYSSSAETELPAPDSTVSEVSFFAIGDVLFHVPLFAACRDDSSLCRFEHVFSHWKRDIESADIAVVNQETVFVPRSEGYSSYPSFGSPEELGLAEIDAGFDIVTHATNHTMDRGERAVDYTLDFWKAKPAKALGIHPTSEDRDSVFTLERNGIRFAFVNFTYGLNGQKLPERRSYLVDLLDSNGNWISLVRRAEAVAEVTVAFMHFGTEYTELPTEEAMRTAEKAIDAGADILVCAHPHVIEPFGIYTTAAGNRALVYWSLGNFISNQQQLETNLGGVAKFTVRKTQREGDIRIEVASAVLEASVTQQEAGNYRAIPLETYTEELAEKHLLRKKIPEFTLANLQRAFQKTLGGAELCRTLPPAEALPLSITNISKSGKEESNF